MKPITDAEIKATTPEKPNFSVWARNIAWLAECGEGLEFNLPGDLTSALEDAYRCGALDAEQGNSHDR